MSNLTMRANTVQQARADAALRTNFRIFVSQVFKILNPGEKLSDAAYLEIMCYQLQEVAEGRTLRLLITIPPRYLKSICTSVALVAWMLGKDPTLKFIVTSYGDDLAKGHATSFRKVLVSPFYRRLFPDVIIDPRANRADEIRTTAGGGRKAVSLGGSVTGFGADVIIIDDLMKAGEVHSERRREEARIYYDETLASRLNNKSTGRIIAIQQRLHQDDFAGYLIEKGTYHHVSLPAIADREITYPLYIGREHKCSIHDVLDPEREPRSRLDAQRMEIGSYAFNAQYLQNPLPSESDFVRLDKMNLIDKHPEDKQFLRIIQSWDTAIKDTPRCDYSVCTTWGWENDKWHLLDIVRERLDYPALKQRVIELKKRWTADKILIEDSANGTAVGQQLRREGMRGIKLIGAKGSKLERFLAQTDVLQSDKIVIPTEVKWFPDLKQELLAFPNTRHDDQVDSVVQFLKWIRRYGNTYLDTDPITGRRQGRYRRSRNR